MEMGSSISEAAALLLRRNSQEWLLLSAKTKLREMAWGL